MHITLLMDNPHSWYYPYAQALSTELQSRGHVVVFVHSTQDMKPGDLACFLSCEKIIKKPIRDLHTHNIVVHSSPLPKGKGWSPLTWSILEGEHTVTNTLFEAVDAVDAGMIYAQNTMTFRGDELLDELHEIQGKSINELILSFVDTYPSCIREGKEQVGEESFYEKRGPQDSELDIHATLHDQFNLLRVVDNEKYPAFFMHKGYKYIVRISKET